ncbi:phospholipase A2 [Streptomyces rectiviolaceus]|uniref:Phospholipase A2 n=1 Tax=Streptomyces rectiviolaceus TaxID=332591 RepID=A0ABP6MEL5_9ACTN
MRRKFSTTIATLALLTGGAVGGSWAAAGSSLAAGATASSPDTSASAPTVREKADRIMNLPYQQFAVTPQIPPFNWTNDGCSVPTGYAPYVEVFRPACVLHDFGYRNYGARHELKLDPTRATKNWIDGRFRTEMRRICDDKYRTPLAHLNCTNAAEAYHLAVQFGGDSSFF